MTAASAKREHRADETRLRGPNAFSHVVRIGDTIRRKTNYWTAAVHALLAHLHANGFTKAPQALGLDNQGREILSLVRGIVPEHPRHPWNFRSRSSLAATARMIREFHDAVGTFAPPSDAHWRGISGAPPGNDVICHNDLGPFNTVFRRGQPVAIIDWNNAAPGSRMWDVACALWRFTPLWGSDAWWGGDWTGNGWRLPLEVKARRMKLFAEVYGRRYFPRWAKVLDLIEARMRSSEL
ncbi:MAG TPA: phosphotransferase, partial [Candidatus Binataceae bacterium]|nr:phosphotransferase [Candidatus Binataceae bacterium]